MQQRVDTMFALKSFSAAFQRGEINVQAGNIHSDVLVHSDEPMGVPRITYASLNGPMVGAIAMISPAGYRDGLPVFQIGYAVLQNLRKRGFAKHIVTCAIDEFSAGISRSGIREFFIEAIVGKRNTASNKVAEAVIGGNPNEILDENTGELSYQYIRMISTN